MNAPTANTIQRVRSGVTQKLPTIGEAAINKANNHSPGALRATGRIPGSIMPAAGGRSKRSRPAPYPASSFTASMSVAAVWSPVGTGVTCR